MSKFDLQNFFQKIEKTNDNVIFSGIGLYFSGIGNNRSRIQNRDQTCSWCRKNFAVLVSDESVLTTSLLISVMKWYVLELSDLYLSKQESAVFRSIARRRWEATASPPHWPADQNAENRKYHVFSSFETDFCTGINWKRSIGFRYKNHFNFKWKSFFRSSMNSDAKTVPILDEDFFFGSKPL